MSINVALISMNDDSQEVVQQIDVFDSLESAESMFPDYDYYIDTTDNSFSPPAEVGSIYDPGTNTFTYPPEDFIDEVLGSYENLVSDIQGMLTLLARMSSNDENSGSDYDEGYSELDISSLPSDFVTNVWTPLQAYFANIVGG